MLQVALLTIVIFFLQFFLKAFSSKADQYF